MIAAAMLYTAAVTLLLFYAAGAVEYLVRTLAVPTRFVWVTATLATLALSTTAIRRTNETRHDPAAASGATPVVVPITVVSVGPDVSAVGSAPRATSHSVVQTLLSAERIGARAVDRMVAGVDVAALDRWNAALVALWIAMSGVALAWLCISLIGARRIGHSLSSACIDEHSVLVSADIGPAILGVFRLRIVVPHWVLSLSPHDRRFILAHEREHAAAFDPALLYGAAFALALQPWNPALWAIFWRLRLAIEADCDQRVLRGVPDPRGYGRLLVEVYQRAVRPRASSLAFVERPSNLELRIRRLNRRPRLLSSTAGGATLLAALLLTAAWAAPTPARGVAAPAQRTTGEKSKSAPPARLPATPTPVRLVESATVLHRTSPGATAPQPSAPASGHDARKYVSPCIFDGRMSGDALSRQPAPPIDCSIDGEVMVFALDSTRVLVAAHDTSQAAVQTASYWVFQVDAGVLPDALSWSTNLGHVDVQGADVYVASPSPGVPALVFGLPGSALAKAHSDALRPTLHGIQRLRQPAVTWDVLRRIPMAHRCSPVIYIDGIMLDCFIVDGQTINID